MTTQCVQICDVGTGLGKTRKKGQEHGAALCGARETNLETICWDFERKLQAWDDGCGFPDQTLLEVQFRRGARVLRRYRLPGLGKAGKNNERSWALTLLGPLGSASPGPAFQTKRVCDLFCDDAKG